MALSVLTAGLARQTALCFGTEYPEKTGFLTMDIHRDIPPHKIDPDASRPCEYCARLDPGFDQRRPLDQLVLAKPGASAGTHVTEGGHVAHRLIELNLRMRAAGVGADRFEKVKIA